MGGRAAGHLLTQRRGLEAPHVLGPCFVSLPSLFPRAPGGRHLHKPISQMGKLRLKEVTNIVQFTQGAGSQAGLGRFPTRACKLLTDFCAPGS